MSEPETQYLKFGVDDSRIPALSDVLIENVRVFEGYKFSEPRSVALSNGKIVPPSTKLSEAVERIDGGDCYLLPGLIESHAHPKNTGDLEALRNSGVTTVMELGSPFPQVIAGLKNLVGLPELYTAGYPATAPNTPHTMLLGPNAQHELTSSPADAVGFVARRLQDGVDYVKIISDTPVGMDQPTMNTIVSHAKQNDKMTMVHAARRDAYLMALNARPSMIHHVPTDSPLVETDNLGQYDFIAVPTLTCMLKRTQVPQGSGDSHEVTAKEHYERVSQMSVTQLRNAGIPILAGSDAAVIPGLPIQIQFGSSLHDELELLVEAGLTNIEAIRAATELPAKYFDLGDRGRIQAGLRADLTLVRGDPLVDIRALRNIMRVWLRGHSYKPSD